jgi:hypothetical protein
LEVFAFQPETREILLKNDTNKSMIVWTSVLGSLSSQNLELDSGFRRSDEHGRAWFLVVIPAEAGIQD